MCNNEIWWTIMNPNTERFRRWSSSNRKHRNNYMNQYRNTPIHKFLEDPDEMWFEKNDRKRKQLKQATPEWVCSEDIRRIYRECCRLNQQYPSTGFVVHHIVPISHPNICGLHTPNNLKIVTLKMKKKLGRKFISSWIEQ